MKVAALCGKLRQICEKLAVRFGVIPHHAVREYVHEVYRRFEKCTSVFVRDENNTQARMFSQQSTHFAPPGGSRGVICDTLWFWFKYGNALQDGVRGGGGLLYASSSSLPNLSARSTNLLTYLLSLLCYLLLPTSLYSLFKVMMQYCIIFLWVCCNHIARSK